MEKTRPGDAVQDCAKVLCLKNIPADPLTRSAYQYAPCSDAGLDSCGPAAENPINYVLAYRLERRAGSIPAGVHYATADDICGDERCP